MEDSERQNPKDLMITWKEEVSELKTACDLQSSGSDFLVDDCAISPSQENRGEAGLGSYYNEFCFCTC